MEFGIEGGGTVSKFMGSLSGENDFGIEGVSHKLALIRWIFCLNYVTEFCLGCNTLNLLKMNEFVLVLSKIDSFSYSREIPTFPSFPLSEIRVENPSGSSSSIQSLSILFHLHGNDYHIGERRRRRIGSVKCRPLFRSDVVHTDMCKHRSFYYRTKVWTTEFGIGGGYRVSKFVGSLLEENGFGVEGVSHKLALIRWIFDEVTEFCFGCNTLRTIRQIPRYPSLPTHPESREENPSGSSPSFRSLFILFHFHGNEYQDGEEVDWQYEISPSIPIRFSSVLMCLQLRKPCSDGTLQLFITGPKFGFVINSEETFFIASFYTAWIALASPSSDNGIRY
ncbi:hypothetical protein CEXT_26421 [Caerostris extrusa]|uniref:Maturase K n=1 Tax=Caerostris extrusa TaxID=172846 RepID=A0AAV4VE62_CAEEX|nr:hypothetical protein CEXT_26421 [Caerostris extrusa]